MKKMILMILSATYMFAMINLQTATKDELMGINGIGAKKADAIIEYRKKNTIKNANDLLNVKGIGPNIVQAVKQEGKKK